MSIKPIIIVIDGNIGVGKSTIISNLKIHFNDCKKIIFVDEPLNDWLSIKDENDTNILQLFYEDKNKHGFIFQLIVLITRITKINNMLKTWKESYPPIIITERSILSDKEIFKKILIEEKIMNKLEQQVYDKIHSFFHENFNETHFIFLCCSSEKSKERMILRNRKEEENVPIEYLQTCFDKYEKMFENICYNKTKINTEQPIENYIYQIINIIQTYI